MGIFMFRLRTTAAGLLGDEVPKLVFGRWKAAGGGNLLEVFYQVKMLCHLWCYTLIVNII